MPGCQHGHHARLGAGAVALGGGEEPSLWCRLPSAGSAHSQESGGKDILAVGLGPVIRDQLGGSREAQDGLARAVAKRRGCPQTPRP